ncbi:oxidoreductase [Aureococcus anophagefferens]|nr:oxidoreductase [Aureococcus anophagefferens]
MANKIGCNLMLALLALLVVGCDAAIVTRRGFALLVVVGCDAAIVTRRDFVGGGAAAAAASRPTAASAAVDARAPRARGLAVPRAGVRHFDAAAAYGNEAALGEALRGGPKCFVATKVAPSRGARDAVKAAADRLGFAPDCVYVHSPLAPRAERLAAYEQLLDARRDGLCGAVGVANFGGGCDGGVEDVRDGGEVEALEMPVALANERDHSQLGFALGAGAGIRWGAGAGID